MHVIFEGLITGLIISISFGAGFFSLIQTSILRGINRAVYISLGVILSDTIFILFSVFATSFISQELVRYEREIRIGGMIMLVLMGIYSIIKSSGNVNSNIVDDPHAMYYVSKGFLVNTLNPLNALTWIAVSVFLQSALQYSMRQIIVYFVTVIFFAFATQMGVCYSSHKLRRWLSATVMHRINIFVGVVFIAIGIFIYFNKPDPTRETPIERVHEMMQKH